MYEIVTAHSGGCFALVRHAVLLQLSSRQIDVGSIQPQKVHWRSHEVRASSHLLEFIPGRDRLWAPETLAAGAHPLSLHLAESADWSLTCKNVCLLLLCARLSMMWVLLYAWLSVCQCAAYCDWYAENGHICILVGQFGRAV